MLKFDFQKKLLLGFVSYGFMLTLIILFFIYQFDKNRVTNSLINSAKTEFIKKERELKEYIYDYENLITSLESSKIFNNYLNQQREIDDTKNLFLDMTKASEKIMQLRYIDISGKELIGINRDLSNNRVYIVDEKDLQNKSDRYYFQEIISQNNRNFWYSNLDLNKEHNSIVKPIVPIIRVAKSIYIDNKRVGVIVVNLFMEESLKSFLNSPKYKIYLVDRDGEFIYHHKEKFLWQRYLKKRVNIKDEFTDEYKEILEKKEFVNRSIYSKSLNIKNSDGLKIIFEIEEIGLNSVIKEYKNEFLIIFVILFCTSIPFAYIFSITPTRLKDRVDTLNIDLEAKVLELEELNSSLEKRIEEEIRKNSEQSRVVFEQNRVKAMGEVIENIAHQWRQPLSIISTLVGVIRIHEELGILTKQKRDEYLKRIEKNSQYLSSIIDDFKKFFKSCKDITNFNLKDNILNTIDIMGDNLEFNRIELIVDLDDIEINSFNEEIKEVTLNILTNARDMFLQRTHIKRRLLFISLKKENNMAVISIKDSAGGIDKEIREKIFEPYFTTKDENERKGIGLYMCYEIVKRHLDGLLMAKNITFTHQEQEYTGALFTVKIPIK